MFPPHNVGLALSGGGSRAAAFHCGTLQALLELNRAESIGVVSTVSGGSLFGGAWLSAKANQMSDADFLSTMRCELVEGFVARSLRPRLLKALLPFVDYSRTNVIADTFDEIFFKGKTLAELPPTPALSINTTILNNGQVGKFSRDGFYAWGLNFPGGRPPHLAPMTDFPLALAVAASAAFPIGLPPVKIKVTQFPDGTRFGGGLTGAKGLSLTDGGVLENLGIQTLLRSHRFGAWDIILSDAGTRDAHWNERPIVGALKSFGVWAASGRILDRIMLVMNDKQNRWARQQIIEMLERSWAHDHIQNADEDRQPIIDALFKRDPRRRGRKLLFVRVNQTWESFIKTIPRYVLVKHALAAGCEPGDVPAPDADLTDVEAFLASVGVNLDRAKQIHEQLGGDMTARKMNDVSTNFTGLPQSIVDQLADHAAWQVHAGAAIYD